MSSPRQALLAALATAGLVLCLPHAARAETLVGVTVTNPLITFDSATPSMNVQGPANSFRPASTRAAASSSSLAGGASAMPRCAATPRPRPAS